MTNFGGGSQVLGSQGIQVTIEAAPREAIQQWPLEELCQSLGTVNLDLTPEELERLRNEG